MKRVWLMAAATALVVGMVGSADAAGDASKGAAQAKSCTGCHGANGEGKGNFPKIAGMSESDFVAAMEAYKSGARANKPMAAAAQRLSDEAIADLAAYYASK